MAKSASKKTDAVISFQKNLKTIRTILNMKLMDLGKLLGLSRQNVWNLEAGHINMSVSQYIAIRHLFEYTINKIEDPNKQRQYKLIISSLVDNAEDPDYDWTEELIRQLTEEEE